MTLLPALIAVFFLGMGALALAAPERITTIQGQPTLTADGRNEVRAVYGGFGVAMAAVLLLGLERPGLRPGIFMTVAAALGGMALGRLAAAALERPGRFYPSWFFCALEAGMALALLASRSG